MAHHTVVVQVLLLTFLLISVIIIVINVPIELECYALLACDHRTMRRCEIVLSIIYVIRLKQLNDDEKYQTMRSFQP